MLTLVTIGWVAGALQVLGYLAYGRLVVRSETSPNGMSWLMWAYGTFVLLAIEFDLDAPVSILILPVLCTLCAVVIALYSFHKSSYIPPQKKDYIALTIDLVLMVAYIGLFIMEKAGLVTHTTQIDIALIFLLLTSVSTIVTFYPILRTTYESPYNEKSLPWFMWTLAYLLLFYVTVGESIGPEYYLYPLLSAVLHFAVGVFALTDESRVST